MFLSCVLQPPSFMRNASTRRASGSFSNPDSVTEKLPCGRFTAPERSGSVQGIRSSRGPAGIPAGLRRLRPGSLERMGYERAVSNAPVVAVVGATGAVGIELLRCLEQRRFPLAELRLFASARSAGKRLTFR